MALGRCLNKEFIPELSLFQKYVPDITVDKYPKIEADHDDSYAEYLKQLDTPEYQVRQDEKIIQLKRELTRMKENVSSPSSANPLQGGKNKKEVNVMDLEQQNSELRGQIIKLKNEFDMLSNRDKKENQSAQLDIETKKNALLQNKIHQLEVQMNSQQDTSSKDKLIQRLQKELEELDKVNQNIHQFYQKENKENTNSTASPSQGEASATISKLQTRVTNLTVLLQQTSKVSFHAFLRKQNEKHQKMQDMVTVSEQKHLAMQEDFLKEKNKIIAFYEEKIKSSDSKYYAESKKLVAQLDQAKEQYKEEIFSLNQAIKNQEIDLADKIKSLRNSSEQISKLTSQVKQKQKEQEELSKKAQQCELKLTSDNAKQISDLQSQFQKEQEKSLKKMVSLETDLANKQTQLSNSLRDYNTLKRDLDLKIDEFEKTKFELETSRNERERLKRDVMNLKNKMENMELIAEKKTQEMTLKSKQLSQVVSERQILEEEISKERASCLELQRKLQQSNENTKSLEIERGRLIQQIEQEKHEIEKKDIEISSLKKQLMEYVNEKTLQMERLKESQINEKLRITDLTEEVQKYKIELNVVQTKTQIMEADLVARGQEVKILKETIERQRGQLDENEDRIGELASEIDQLQQETDQKAQEISNLNAAYEQALIEGEIQQKNAHNYRNALEEKEDDYQNEIERLQNEIAELTRSIATCKEREQKTNALNHEINNLLSELRNKLSEREKELQSTIEEASQSKNSVSQKESRLEHILDQMGEKDSRCEQLETSLKRVNEELEQCQCQEQLSRQEIEQLNGNISSLRENQVYFLERNKQLQATVTSLSSQIEDLQKSLQQLTLEKELSTQNKLLLQEAHDKLHIHNQQLLQEQQRLLTQYENLNSTTICLQVHNQAVEKLEIEIHAAQTQLQDVVKEQGQLVQELILAETALKDTKRQLQTQETISSQHLQTIYSLTTQLNGEKRDSETQWEEEIEEKGMTLSSYEAQKFRKILKGIDQQNKIPIKSQKQTEHIDLTQALKRTAFMQESINFSRMEEGTKMLFIPSTSEIYIPLILKQINEGAFLDSNSNMSHNESSCISIQNYKNNYFLDFDTLDKKYKELLHECTLLMVASIKNIIPKIANLDNNPFGLRENESYYLLQVEHPDYIVGLEDDDHSIKNYA